MSIVEQHPQIAPPHDDKPVTNLLTNPHMIIDHVWISQKIGEGCIL